MDLRTAFQIVLDLARQNIPNVNDGNEDLQTQIEQQEEAIRIIEDLVVTQFGED